MRFVDMLPKAKALPVRVAVLTTCFGFWFFATILFYKTTLFGIVIGAALAVIAIYLWQLRAWARKAATICIATSVFLFMCGGIFNPFFLMDYRAEHGGEFHLLRWALISLPGVAVAVWCYWVLSRRRDEFGRKA